MPKKSKAKRVSPRTIYGDGITIGNYRLTKTLNPDAIWIVNPIGEALMTPEARLELAIGRYFRKEF